ncbi:nuclear transport factor 2 family protein [Pediococcus claussenii]|nr:nuclear transport factor 2 family protein [Pediococcus claussenii]ANZ69904.1 hypothetical protein AYR57_06085 [Pediococcus claussenii]ANZ71721.1 hypothetical protein AYR58_06090 [Pediococcus claussenii]
MENEIFQLLIKADELATERDIEGYRDLFISNGEILFNNRIIAGKDNIADFVAQTWDKEPVGSVHLLFNPLVLSDEGDSALITTRLLILDPSDNQIWNSTKITHTLVKRNSKWQYKKRKVE